MRCRNCGNPNLVEMLDLGQMPLANALLDPLSSTKPARTFPLGWNYCEMCGLVQLTHIHSPIELYEDYPFVTGTAETTREHFRELAHRIVEVLETWFSKRKKMLVLDIGSNDGTLLKEFKWLGFKVVGVEPADNIAKIAKDAGIPTVTAFWSPDVARKVIQEYGNPDVVTATNVFTHVDDLTTFLEAMDIALAPNGVLVLELYYLPSILQATAWDMIYHEHLTYFTLKTLQNTLRRRGYDVFHAEITPVHCDSLRVFVKAIGDETHPVDGSVDELLAKEGVMDLPTSIGEFARRIEAVKGKTKHFFDEVHRLQQLVIGYGAPAKATTYLNYCGVSSYDMAHVIDDNPLKWDRVIPGTGISIVGPEWLKAGDADIALILAWNLADDIKAEVRRMRGESVRVFVATPGKGPVEMS